MTFLYTRTNTWSSAPQPTEETINYWKHISQKKNWRIVQLPKGTEVQRPATGVEGMIRYNVDNSKLEVYTGSSWEIVTSV